MEIVYVYQKKRKEFGKHCNFSDKPAELLVDIAPDATLKKEYILRMPAEASVSCEKDYSEHEVNTERVETETRGINHVEGGWPKDVDPNEVEQVLRFRKKVEKEESYVSAMTSLGTMAEHCIQQNLALDIYENYFLGSEEEVKVDAPTARTINVFRDPSEHQRTATCLSWYPEGPKKIAVAYCVMEFQQAPANISYDSYIWDIANPTTPETTLSPSSPLVCIEYNPKDVHTLVGGCYNGQIAVFDVRRGSRPVETTPVEISHRDPVYKARFMQSKTGTEFFTSSSDGQVLWWDLRKMTEPVETLSLDVDKNGNLLGGVSLDYESTLPTKFMVGTEQGLVLNGNRKAKNPGEKIVATYQAHYGPVYALARNSFFPKFFLTVGDWSSKIFCEDLKESPIIWSKYNNCLVSDGAWSPTRPAVSFIAKQDGSLDVFDYLFKPTDPMLSVQVCDSPLHCLRVHEQGGLVACGAKDGSVTLLELSESLSRMQQGEKPALSAMLDRETAREKIVASRMRELALKQKAEAERVKSARDAPEAIPDEDDPIVRAERNFWDALHQRKAGKKKAQEEGEGEGEGMKNETVPAVAEPETGGGEEQEPAPASE